MASSSTGIATGSASSSVDVRAANAFIMRDRVPMATGRVGHVAVVRDDRRCTVVQPVVFTLGDAVGATTLGGGAGGVAVGGVVSSLAVGVVVACVLVEWSSARRASMATSWS